MINKRVYKQLLTETIVPEMLTGEDKVKAYYRLESYVNDNIPQKLYRYRRCKDDAMNIVLMRSIKMNCGFLMVRA